jgi:isochorismate synthase
MMNIQLAVSEKEPSIPMFSKADILRFLEEVDFNRIAFGFLYFPELDSFRLIHCPTHEVMAISQPSVLSNFAFSRGFVAFPFDNRKDGFLIPDRPGNYVLKDVQPSKLAEPEKKSVSKDSYCQLVQDAVSGIQDGQFEKLVVSRIHDVDFSEVDFPSLVSQIMDAYPKANLSVFNLPDAGLWLNVSPEWLGSYQKGEGIRTMALAGTRRFRPDFHQVSMWSSKELVEQAIVAEFIREGLRRNEMPFWREKGPYPVQAGNLLHLRTDFQVPDAGLNRFFALMEFLHPTSAVSGMPQAESRDWIIQQEGFDREFYAGFSGVIEKEEARWVVNLRTARYRDGLLRLFAGAGITGNSIPEKEWEETGAKLYTIGRFLPGVSLPGYETI